MDISREILQFLHYHPLSLRDEIASGTAFEGSDATMKRLIAAVIKNGDIVVEGKARATRYRLSDQAHLLMPLNLDTYFAQDVDERQVCGDVSLSAAEEVHVLWEAQDDGAHFAENPKHALVLELQM